MFKNFNEDFNVKPGDSQVQNNTNNQEAFWARAVPSALVCGQFFLKDGCSLLQKVNLEKTPWMRRGECGLNGNSVQMVR